MKVDTKQNFLYKTTAIPLKKMANGDFKCWIEQNIIQIKMVSLNVRIFCIFIFLVNLGLFVIYNQIAYFFT